MEPEPKIDLTDTETVFYSTKNTELKTRYFWFKYMMKPGIIKVIEYILPTIKILPSWSFKWIMKKSLYKYFIGGETLQECKPKIEQLFTKNIGSIPDLSVESAHNEDGIEFAINEILKTIELSQENNKKVPLTVFKITGLIKVDILKSISKKLKEGTSLNTNEIKYFNILIDRINKLCKSAYDKKVRIMIDAEESWIQDAIDNIALKMMETYNKEEVIVINTYQMYRKNGLNNLKLHFDNSTVNKFKLGVKLVRGAYMEKERQFAIENNYESPIFDTKDDTDNEYNLAIKFCLENIQSIFLIIGTHNKISIEYLMKLMKEKDLPNNFTNIYFSQLYGMGDNLSYNLTKHGYNCCKYLPFGTIKDVIPYLIRRARENSSVNGFMSSELQNIVKELNRRKKIAA